MITLTTYYVLCGVLSLLALLGISLMSKVSTAVRGNLLLSFCMLAGFVATMLYYQILEVPTIYALILVGSIVGGILAYRVKMIEMPQTVAMLNGLGGLAGAIVGGLTLIGIGVKPSEYPVFVNFTASLAVVVGMVTFVGSMIAAAKLHRLLPQQPVVWKNHQAIVSVLMMACVASVVFSLLIGKEDSFVADSMFVLILGTVAGSLFGWAFAIRVGGADMPITISLLTSLAGVAAAIAGMAIGDILVVSIGGIVGSSGLILTQIMCKAMNRKLMVILMGNGGGKPAVAAKTESAIGAKPGTVPVYGKSEAPTAKLETAAIHGKSEVGSHGKLEATSYGKSDAATSVSTAPAVPASAKQLAAILKAAKRVIIVPGYGMALAQAQHQVRQLADLFESKGASVKYAIHPVAGRMPGHMNVLLAEADVSYDQLYEMDAVNDEFAETDVVVVIGANDVLNPAARDAEGTPIYGMPVLNVDQARQIIICNFDLKPGYAGVPNPLYDMAEKVTMMLGDAKKTLTELIGKLESGEDASEEVSTEASTADAEELKGTSAVNAGEGLKSVPAASTTNAGEGLKSAPAASTINIGEVLKSDPAASTTNIGEVLKTARKVIIVPGYGMALAQAQHQVRQLADLFESKGASVKYAIHPVAGRMPGHMNVLLAEADVSYDQLYEMDAINHEFAETDVVVVIGANDVLNPAARDAEGTPIYGMPVLNVDQAKQIIICNFDLKPGYAGVLNPLYDMAEKVTMLTGDAKKSLSELIGKLM